jgi:1-acyl-sn-glycerol-3-phosphate acyltransferase
MEEVLNWPKDPKQAIPLLGTWEYIEKHKPFSSYFSGRNPEQEAKSLQTGLKILCKNTPSVYVVPLSITILESVKMIFFH